MLKIMSAVGLAMKLLRRISCIWMVILVVGTMMAYLHPAQAATDPCAGIRWAQSSNRIYVTGPGTYTLTEIDACLSSLVPLDLVDGTNHIWFLGANLILEEGATLLLHGTGAGGDVDELRLRSNNSSDANSVVFIRADWGTISIENTSITSWNELSKGPDTEYKNYKRSYIQARSRLAADGVTPLESRMDIINSDIGYLGYYGGEAYGLSWKVNGSQPNLYNKVDVFGDVKNSRIHHNYFGAYTYGAYEMQWLGNEIDNNVVYGLDLHDDSDSILVEGNDVHHNGNHGIVASQRCDSLTIRDNESHHNGGNGIMLHRNTNNSLVEENLVNYNADSGIAIFDSHDNTIGKNTSKNNERGMRLSVGSSNNVIENNAFSSNTQYGVYFYKGSDTPTSGDGRPKSNRFADNAISSNGDYGIKLQQADDNIFQDNTVENNARGIYLYDAGKNTFIGNTLANNGRYNFYYAKFQANNTIEDTDVAPVKIDDNASSMDIVSTQNYVFGNNKKIATVAQPEQTLIHFTRGISGAIVTFERLNLRVMPSSNQVLVSPQVWRTSGDYYKSWTESSESSTTANHIVGDLKPNIPYNVIVDGRVWNSYTSDPQGYITFLYDGGYSRDKVFEVVEQGGKGETLKFSPVMGSSREIRLYAIRRGWDWVGLRFTSPTLRMQPLRVQKAGQL